MKIIFLLADIKACKFKISVIGFMPSNYCKDLEEDEQKHQNTCVILTINITRTEFDISFEKNHFHC